MKLMLMKLNDGLNEKIQPEQMEFPNLIVIHAYSSNIYHLEDYIACC